MFWLGLFPLAAQENATTIVFRMLDKILAPELVPSILEKFIKPYLCEHNLQKDELLLQYVKVSLFSSFKKKLFQYKEIETKSDEPLNLQLNFRLILFLSMNLMIVTISETTP